MEIKITFRRRHIKRFIAKLKVTHITCFFLYEYLRIDFRRYWHVYLLRSFLLCIRSCKHKSPWYKSHDPRTAGRYTASWAHRILCPSSRWNRGSGPWSTGRCRYTAPDRLLWNKTRQGIISHASPKIRSKQQHVVRTSAMPFLPPQPSTSLPVLGVCWMTRVSTQLIYLGWRKESKSHTSWTIRTQKSWKTMAGSRNALSISMAISGALHHRLWRREKEAILAEHPASSAR